MRANRGLLKQASGGASRDVARGAGVLRFEAGVSAMACPPSMDATPAAGGGTPGAGMLSGAGPPLLLAGSQCPLLDGCLASSGCPAAGAAVSPAVGLAAGACELQSGWLLSAPVVQCSKAGSDTSGWGAMHAVASPLCNPACTFVAALAASAGAGCTGGAVLSPSAGLAVAACSELVGGPDP